MGWARLWDNGRAHSLGLLCTIQHFRNARSEVGKWKFSLKGSPQ